MNDIEHFPVLPRSFFRVPAPAAPKRASRWPRFLAVAGIVAAGLALGVGDFAATAAGMDHFGWRQGARLAIAQHVVARALDSVGASSAVEAKAHDIIATKFAEMTSDSDQRDAMRKRAMEIIGAPTIDRAAAETLRSEVVARFDAKSKLVVSGLLDIADLLTPEQRTQLAAEIEHMRSMGGGPMGGPDIGPGKD
jgi:Spy/CpxP family protein refolding chaperone